MKIVNKVENGPVLIVPDIHKDDRGYFYESFNDNEFREKVYDTTFVQDNQSLSSRGVLRGMHFQKGEFAQAKLVRVINGAVLDVVMDIRDDSPNQGKVYSYLLTQNNHYQLFVPRGFAHGFLTLADNTIFQYKCDNFYNKESEGSINYKSIGFDWDHYMDPSEFITSPKDEAAPDSIFVIGAAECTSVVEIDKDIIKSALKSAIEKSYEDAIRGGIPTMVGEYLVPIEQEIFADINYKGEVLEARLIGLSPILFSVDGFTPTRKILVRYLKTNEEVALSDNFSEVIRFYKKDGNEFKQF